jgi:predicted Zn finger-like uncharacterized protein
VRLEDHVRCGSCGAVYFVRYDQSALDGKMRVVAETSWRLPAAADVETVLP